MKKGFTLAESMLTMIIIAIVASIAIPAFKNAQPNQEMMMLKKAYYLTGRLINELINDDEFYPENEDENSGGFSQTNQVTYHGQSISGNTKFCELFAGRMNVKGNISCNASITKANTFPNNAAPVGNGHFTTNDGIVWVLPIGSFANAKESIYIDVNGEKGQNCFPSNSCGKPDRFEIKIDRFGKMYVEDDATRKYLSTTDTTKSLREIR